MATSHTTRRSELLRDYFRNRISHGTDFVYTSCLHFGVYIWGMMRESLLPFDTTMNIAELGQAIITHIQTSSSTAYEYVQ